MKQFIYADNAATTKLEPQALEAMLPWLTEAYGNPSQPYSFSRAPKKAIAEARETIAACIGADPEEIYFTSGGTESDNWAIKGSALADPAYRSTITTAFEHHAVLNACSRIETLKYPVAYMWPTQGGRITAEILKDYISDETRLVSVMFANNELGTIQPIKELCEIAHKHGAVFHTDAVQAVGHIPIGVRELGVDMLSASAHKFGGPRGVGFLYIRKDTKIQAHMDGGAQERGMRAGTENTAGIVGMATALKISCDSMDANAGYVRKLENMLLDELSAAGVPFCRNGCAPFLPGLLSLAFPGMSGEAMFHRLDLMGIMVSTGSACDSKNTQVSHVLQAIRLDDELANGTIRISLGKNNIEDDVITIAKALRKITMNV